MVTNNGIITATSARITIILSLLRASVEYRNIITATTINPRIGPREPAKIVMVNPKTIVINSTARLMLTSLDRSTKNQALIILSEAPRCPSSMALVTKFPDKRPSSKAFEKFRIERNETIISAI